MTYSAPTFTRKVDMSPGLRDTGDVIEADDINELQEAMELAGSEIVTQVAIDAGTRLDAVEGYGTNARIAIANVRDYGAVGDGNADDTTAFDEAYAALPDPSSGVSGGGVILVPAGYYGVSKVQLLKTKPVTIMRDGGLSRRFGQYSVASSGDAVLIGADSGAGSCIFAIDEPTSSVTNGYGFQFKGLQFDLTGNTVYGIYGENINGTVIEDCSAFGPSAPTVAQWLTRGKMDATHGDDCSWWRIRDCHTNRVGLATNGTSSVQSCNQWGFERNIVFPGDQVDACISLIGNDRVFTISNNFEVGTNTGVYGMHLESCTRGVHLGDAGEARTGATFIYARSSNGNLFAPVGNSSSTDATDILIDDDGANVLLTPVTTGLSDLYSGYEGRHIQHSGKYPQTGFGTHGLLSSTLASIPNHLQNGRWQFVKNLYDVGSIVAEYWDGASWSSWSPTNLANLSVDNTTVITIDETHKKCRFRMGTTGSPDWPFILCRMIQGTGSPTGDIDVTVEAVASDTTTVQQTFTTTLTLDSVFEGFTFPLQWIAGTYVRVTLDTPVSGSETLSMSRLACYTASSDRANGKNVAGRVMKGIGDPSSVIYGSVGDLFLRTDGGTGTTLYVKESGSNTTSGWVAK